jgi:hypothetical protein
MQPESTTNPGSGPATAQAYRPTTVPLDQYIAPELAPEARAFYRRALDTLKGDGVPFLVGGAYALAHYTGVVRHTKDLDVFVRPPDCARTLEALARVGCRPELTFPHWLGKAFHGENFVDVNFSSGNGLCRVDDGWFDGAEEARVFGTTVRLVPVEEMIWSKGFVQERERYDGADIDHLLRAAADRLDWRRLFLHSSFRIPHSAFARACGHQTSKREPSPGRVWTSTWPP